MKISPVSASIFSQRVPAIVVFAFENEKLAGPASLHNLLRRLTEKEFKGSERQLVLLHTGGKAGVAAPRTVLAGLGKRETATTETIRRATGNALKRLRDAGLDRAAVQLPETNEALHAIVEAAELANYTFTEFKFSDEAPTRFQSLTICLPAKYDLHSARRTIGRAQAIAGAANFAREISNLPGNFVYPSVLADRARELAKQLNLKCTVLSRRALEAGKFGGLLAVGGGSQHEPQLIVLEYTGIQNPKPSDLRSKSKTESARQAKQIQNPIALVGKAITFDSGGISIKPSDKMDEMKFDKSGGVAVLGAMRAVAELKLPLNVIGVIAAAENMPSATSYRPGDIVTSYPGIEKRAVTIEVLNTDAEGRVVLGDALAYARERKPQAIIDLATLTGACVVALGGFAAGLMGNDQPLQDKLRAAGERTGERVWPLPLWQDYKEKVKSDVADIKNTAGREGGAITAAAFLAKYVGDIPWAHLDIAGTAWTTEERPYLAKGATGFGVRLLLDVLSQWA
jgi:leucyl aminopeptidase